MIDILSNSIEIYLRWMPQDLNDDKSGNGFVPSGSKVLLKPILTKFCVAICRLYGPMT